METSPKEQDQKGQLLNMSQLAKKIGCSKWYVTAMRQAGLPIFCRRITLHEALEWMRGNPEFKTTGIYPKRARNQVQTSKRSGA